MFEKIATYIFAQCVLNSTSGVYGVDIEEIEKTFDIKITFEDYERICEETWELYGDKLIDINNEDNDYYFNEQKEFNLNIGTDYLPYYYDEDDERSWGEKDESEDE